MMPPPGAVQKKKPILQSDVLEKQKMVLQATPAFRLRARYIYLMRCQWKSGHDLAAVLKKELVRRRLKTWDLPQIPYAGYIDMFKKKNDQGVRGK